MASPPGESNPRALSLADTARLLGVHRNAVRAWIDRGCPVVARSDTAKGVAWTLDLRAIVEWREREAARKAREQLEARHVRIVEALRSQLGGGSEAVSKEEGERRERVAKAQLAELELARQRRDLVSIADIRGTWAIVGHTIRNRLLAVPSKVAPLLALAETTEERSRLISDHVREALHDLSNREPTAETDDAPSLAHQFDQHEQWPLADTTPEGVDSLRTARDAAPPQG